MSGASIQRPGYLPEAKTIDSPCLPGTPGRSGESSPRPEISDDAPQNGGSSPCSSEAQSAFDAAAAEQRIRSLLGRARSREPSPATSGATLESVGAPATPPRTEVKPRRLKLVQGAKHGHVDAGNAVRGCYAFDLYLQPNYKFLADPGQLSGAHQPPLTSLAQDPSHALGHEALPADAGAFAADTATSALLGPLSFLASRTAYRLAKASLAGKRALSRRIGENEKRQAALTPTSRAGEAQGVALAVEKETLERAKKNASSRFRESALLAVGHGAVAVKTAFGLGTKVASAAAGGGASAAGVATAATVLGAVGAFFLAPIAAFTVLAETGFSFVRSRKAKAAFKEVGPDTAAYFDAIKKTRPEGIDGEFAPAYVEFVEHKLSVREKFARRFKNWSKFRFTAAAIFGATTTTKVVIGIVALCAGGFALATPIGWALLGVGIAAALISTVGAFAFTFNRTSARYDQYHHADTELIDREFHRELAAIEAGEQPALRVEEEAPRAALVDDQPHSESQRAADAGASRMTPPVSQPAARSSARAAEDAAWRDGDDDGEDDGEEDRTPYAPQSARREMQPLLAGGAFGGPSGSDGDDDDDDAPVVAPPTVFHAAPLGFNLRARQFGMISQQGASLARFQHGLQTTYNKPAAAGLRGLLANLGARFKASFSWAATLARTFSPRAASRVYRARWAAGAARLTHTHYHAEIARGTQGWREFMRAHVGAEIDALTYKIALRASLSANAEGGSAISQSKRVDEQRLEKLQSLKARIEETARGLTFEVEAHADPVANRAFLALIQNQAAPEGLSDEEVTGALARAMKTHLERRFRDLKGVLVETEFDATRARSKASA